MVALREIVIQVARNFKKIRLNCIQPQRSRGAESVDERLCSQILGEYGITRQPDREAMDVASVLTV